MRTDDDVFVHATSYHANLPGASVPRIEPHGSIDGIEVVVKAPDIAAVTPVTDVAVTAETTPDRVTIRLEDLDQHEVVRLSR